MQNADVAKKRFQVAGLPRSTRYGQRVSEEVTKSLAHCIHEIYAKEGLRGLYKGALPSIIKAAPAAAVTFATYEFMLRALAEHQRQRAQQQRAQQQQQQAQRGQQARVPAAVAAMPATARSSK